MADRACGASSPACACLVATRPFFPQPRHSSSGRSLRLSGQPRRRRAIRAAAADGDRDERVAGSARPYRRALLQLAGAAACDAALRLPVAEGPPDAAPHRLWSRLGGSGAEAAEAREGGRGGLGEAQAEPRRPAGGVGWSGTGAPDVAYPSVFKGVWRCSSALTAVALPQGEAAADMAAVRRAEKELLLPVVYTSRFFEFGGRVVADRALTTRSLVEALMGPQQVQEVQWSPQRPNVLLLRLRGGYVVQNTVTRRSFEQTGPRSFLVSEYSLQVFDNPRVLDGPPTVKASENVAEYWWEDGEQPRQMKARQEVRMFGVPGAAQEGQLLAALRSEPVAVYTYELELTRDA